MRSPLPASLLLSVWLAVSACGLTTSQKDAIGQFSRASTTFGATTSAELIEMRSTVIELNTYVLALDPTKLRDRDKLDAAFSTDRVSARVRAANVIRTYGELLTAIVSDTQEKELQAASGNFTQSVRGLDADRAKISDKELDGVGQVVAAIGGLWVEHKKANALKEIVPRAHPQVAELGRLFQSEFDPATGALARNFEATGQLAIRASDGVLDESRSTMTDRTLAATAQRRGLETSRKANALFPSLSVGATQMVEAHFRLVEGLSKDRFSIDDIKNFTKTVQQLVSTAKVLGDK